MLLQNVGFDVLLNGQTKLSGKWARGPATIAYPLGENIFIIGYHDGHYLKMVKIRVTGEHTFVWMSAKYRFDHPYKCEAQLTFYEDCFQGIPVRQAYYNVKLVAVATSGRKTELNRQKFSVHALEIIPNYKYICN